MALGAALICLVIRHVAGEPLDEVIDRIGRTPNGNMQSEIAKERKGYEMVNVSTADEPDVLTFDEEEN